MTQEEILDNYYEIFQKIADLDEEITNLKEKMVENNIIKIDGDDYE